MQDIIKKDHDQAGFTLIKVMLALAILGISAFALVEATSRCVAALRQSTNYQTARLILKQGELDYPMFKTNAPEDNEVQGETYDNGFTFSRTLTQYTDEESLYLVTTRVSWSERGQSSFEEIESLYYYPPEEFE